MDKFPTPEELGERLKRGDITKEEAIEIMSERARSEALQGLYGPPPDQASNGKPENDGMRAVGTWIVVAIITALALVYVLLQFLE